MNGHSVRLVPGLTQDVKAWIAPRACARDAMSLATTPDVQTPRKCNENRPLFGRLVGSIAAVMTVGLLAGASCKKEPGSPKANPQDVVNAADKAKDGGSGGAAVAVDRTPIAGFDVAKLEPANRQELFFKHGRPSCRRRAARPTRLRTSVAQRSAAASGRRSRCKLVARADRRRGRPRTRSARDLRGRATSSTPRRPRPSTWSDAPMRGQRPSASGDAGRVLRLRLPGVRAGSSRCSIAVIAEPTRRKLQACYYKMFPLE
jgi:hypothetical protein